MSASGEDFGEDDMTSVPEDSHPEEKQENTGELGVGNGEKRWPGWPGENVFRILVPSQKVGGIIGRKGEFIKRMCEETKARIKILDGPPGTQERAVFSANLRKQMNYQSDSKLRRISVPACLY